MSFIPFYKTETGKYVQGIEVKKSLNVGFISAFRSGSDNYSSFFSRAGINDFPRWQFYNNTHPPLLILTFIAVSATCP